MCQPDNLLLDEQVNIDVNINVKLKVEEHVVKSSSKLDKDL